MVATHCLLLGGGGVLRTVVLAPLAPPVLAERGWLLPAGCFFLAADATSGARVLLGG